MAGADNRSAQPTGRPRSLRESDVVATVVRYLEVAGVRDVNVEVRSHGTARADIAYLDGRDLVAVEAKLSDWRRAIAQAVLNRLCFDRSYIALWHGAITPEVIAEARRFGLGVLGVTAEDVTTVRHAPRARPGAHIRRATLSRVQRGMK
jgi:hypothetical protein